jgi:hypothetical protein
VQIQDDATLDGVWLVQGWGSRRAWIHGATAGAFGWEVGSAACMSMGALEKCKKRADWTFEERGNVAIDTGM